MVGGSVSVQRVRSYEEASVKEAVKKIFATFGGPSSIAKGRKVLVKPNVLRAADPEEAVTTHPSVVKAVCEIFIEAGYQVCIGEGPGGAPAPSRPAFLKSGIAQVAESLGIALLSFQETGSVKLELPFGPVRWINIAKPLLEQDTIINVPKLKTHSLTGITCALKNLYGYIPGFLKGKLHALAPKVQDFCGIICALWKVLPAQFTVVDAVTAMEGQGPSAGDPREVGLIFGGEDPVAVDKLAAKIIGFDPDSLPLLKVAEFAQVGSARGLRVLGPPLNEIVVPDFKLPSVSVTSRLLPRWLTALVSPLAERVTWVRPEVIPERCKKCGKCHEACPTGAMYWREGEVARLNSPRDCISCLCCQEICPARAIRLRKSLLLRPFLSVEDRSQEKASSSEW